MILPSLFGTLLRFRLSPIGITSDIEKAFLNIGLQISDRDATRFLWLKDTTNNVQTFRFCRVPFGVVSSPFLLGATITYHLQKISSSLAKQVQQNIYVDNLITGTQTLAEAKSLYGEAKEIFATVSMNLREWASNSEELLSFIPASDRADQSILKVLGLNWNLKNDTLSIPGVSDHKIGSAHTKREALKIVGSILILWDTLLPQFYRPNYSYKNCGQINLTGTLSLQWKE